MSERDQATATAGAVPAVRRRAGSRRRSAPPSGRAIESPSSKTFPRTSASACLEQFYDDDVSEALRRLAEEGFPAAKADREISVPVFSLTGRIQSRPTLPDDTYVD